MTRGTSFGSQNYSPESVQTDLQRYMYYGVGAVAVLGTDIGDAAFDIRSQQQAGGLPATARVFTAGRGITARNGFPSSRSDMADVPIQVGTEDEARQAVRDLAAQNVDFVKIWVDDNRQVSGQMFSGGRLVSTFASDPKLSPALYGAVIDEAHQNNIRVVAHVRNLADGKGLIAAGVDGLVHSIRDRAVDQAFIDAMLENDVFYTPTLAGHEAEFIYSDEPEWLSESFLRESVSGAVISRLRSPAVVAGFRDNLNGDLRRQEFETAMDNFKTLYDAGVRIGMGSDSGAADKFPGFTDHHELELMVAAGLTPMQAIEVGAMNSAAILGVDDEIGTLEIGKRGNFTIVPGDPTVDIRATRNIAGVFVDGVQLDRSSMMVNFTN
jgi:imidazolonepropionase-like amidohydrolase